MSASATHRHVWSAYVLGGVTVLALSLVWQGLFSPRAALAQVPDSGKQRNEMIEEQKTTNKKLTEIAGYLREIRDAQAGQKPKDAKEPAPKRTEP